MLLNFLKVKRKMNIGGKDIIKKQFSKIDCLLRRQKTHKTIEQARKQTREQTRKQKWNQLYGSRTYENIHYFSSFLVTEER